MVSTGQGFIGNNMFVYCNNNPVHLADPTGEIAITTLILIGSAIVGAVAAGYTAYVEYQAGFSTEQIITDSIIVGLCAFNITYSCGMTLYQCYQYYCYLNGLTPVTDIGGNPSADQTTLYRAVSPEEYNSTTNSQTFTSGPNSYEDSKYFATTQADAQRWGELMYKNKDYYIMTATFSSDITTYENVLFYERLDGIGPAYLIPNSALNSCVNLIR